MAENKNPQNPYRQYGKLHNEGLSYVLTRLAAEDVEKLTSSGELDKRIAELVCDYIASISRFKTPADKAYITSIAIKVLNADPDGTIEKILNPFNLNPKTIGYISAVQKITADSLEKVKQQLEKIEQDILRSNLPDSEKDLALFYLAVAYASAEFPEAVEKGSKKPSRLKRLLQSIVKWPWKSDAKGALHGMKDGLISGIPELGKGLEHYATHIGIEALTGAIAASVKQAVQNRKEKPTRSNKADEATKLKDDLEKGKKIKEEKLKAQQAQAAADNAAAATSKAGRDILKKKANKRQRLSDDSDEGKTSK